jgi:hypothetical protein
MTDPWTSELWLISLLATFCSGAAWALVASNGAQAQAVYLGEPAHAGTTSRHRALTRRERYARLPIPR